MDHILTSAIRFGMDLAVKATVIFLATTAALLLLRGSSAATRHRVGTFGLAAALFLPILLMALPRVAVPLLPDPAPAARTERKASVSTVDAGKRSQESQWAAWRRIALSVPEKALPATPEDRRDLVTPAVSMASKTARLPPAAPSRDSWPGAALAMWALGVLAVGTRLLVGWTRLRRIAREAAPIREAAWIEERDAAAIRLGVARDFDLVESGEVPVAMTSGFRRPLLLISRAARLWAVERRRIVLLHEIAHIRRGDWPALLMAELAAILYWFHPLAWWLTRRVRRDAEQACDDLVISTGTKPSVYAGHLLGIFRSLAAPSRPVAPALTIARPHHFEERLRAILDPRAPRADRPGGKAHLYATGLLASALAVAVVSPWKPAIADPAASCPAVLAAHASSPSSGPAPKNACVNKPAAKQAGVVPSVAQTTQAPDEATVEDAVSEESGKTVPAIWKALPGAVSEGVSEAMRGFVSASNHQDSSTRRDGERWYDRAMQRHREERYPEAIEDFQKAIEAGYREGTSSYNIACGYARLGNRDLAFEWLHRAMDAGFEVGSYLGEDDDLDGLQSDPRWAELKKTARAQKSSKYENEGRSAVARYERLAARSSASGESFFDVGRELLRAERYDVAAKAYQQAIDRGFRTGTSLYNQACAFSLAGDKDAALDRLGRALEAGFDQPDMFRTDDDLDAVRDDPRFAALERQARDLSLPGYGTGYWSSKFASNRSRWPEAARRFEDYTAKHPDNGRAWFNLGYASLAGEHPENAARAFQKALELGYRKPTTMYNLACSFARLDQKDAAFDWLFKAIHAGFDATGTLRGDDDLDNLRGDPRYRKALAMAKATEAGEKD